jgi:adenylate cyclase
MHQPDDLVDEMREALGRAESFGDISGVVAAQFAYGTALLRAGDGSPDEAIEVLRRAQASSRKHNVVSHMMTAIGADLAIDAARNGRRDEALDELRALFSIHMRSGLLGLVGCTGEALVSLLIDRASTDDLAEVGRILDAWVTRRPDIPATDLWWLRSRALLAKAEGNMDGYVDLATQYLNLCEKLDARGRLAEARRLVDAWPRHGDTVGDYEGCGGGETSGG